MRQPVVGTIIIGVLVTIQGLWALALALDSSIFRRSEPIHLLIASLLGFAIILLVAAVWPRSKTPEPISFTPVTVDQARLGISTEREMIADLRWIDSPDAVVVPLMTTESATIIVNPDHVVLRTSAPLLNPECGMSRWGADGNRTVYVGSGVTDPSQALLTVDLTARSVTLRSHALPAP